MLLFVVSGIVVVAALVMPQAFADLARATIEHPIWGIGLLAVLGLIFAWINNR